MMGTVQLQSTDAMLKSGSRALRAYIVMSSLSVLLSLTAETVATL